MLMPYPRPFKSESPWGCRLGDVVLVAPLLTLETQIAVNVGNYCPCIWLIRKKIKPERKERYLAVDPSVKVRDELECDSHWLYLEWIGTLVSGESY